MTPPSTPILEHQSSPSRSRLISRKVVGSIAALVSAMAVATKPIFVKVLYAVGMSPAVVLELRMVYSLPVFLGVSVWHIWRRPNAKPSRQEWLKIVFIGFIGYYLASLLDLHGLNYITASLETIVLFSYPTLVALSSVIWFGVRLRKTTWAGLAVAYLGILFAFLGDVNVEAQGNLWLGGGLVFAAAVAMAAYTLASEGLVKRLGSAAVTAYSMSLSAGFIAVHHLVFTEPTAITGFGVQTHLGVIGLALISTALPCFLFLEGIRLVGATRATILVCTSPIFTIALAAWWLGERISYLQAIGSLLVLCGALSLIDLKRGPSIRR